MRMQRNDDDDDDGGGHIRVITHALSTVVMENLGTSNVQRTTDQPAASQPDRRAPGLGRTVHGFRAATPQCFVQL